MRCLRVTNLNAIEHDLRTSVRFPRHVGLIPLKKMLAGLASVFTFSLPSSQSLYLSILLSIMMSFQLPSTVLQLGAIQVLHNAIFLQIGPPPTPS